MWDVVKYDCAVNLVNLIMPRAECSGEESLPTMSRTAIPEQTIQQDAIQTLTKIDAVEQHMLNPPAYQCDKVFFRRPCCSVAAWHAFTNSGSQLTKILLDR
jgi:hypothetical protein